MSPFLDYTELLEEQESRCTELYKWCCESIGEDDVRLAELCFMRAFKIYNYLVKRSLRHADKANARRSPEVH